MTDYKTIYDYNSKAHVELMEKQAKLLELMSRPVMTVTEKTLRDEFAMAALTSMLSPTQDITPSTPAYAAELAYRFADAMMEARK